jgi:hypothetical protein
MKRVFFSMSSQRHEKPTVPFGHIAFSKVGKVDVSLSNLPRVKKLKKRYAPDREAATWLLIFTTSPHILHEISRDGELAIEEPLRRAREFSAARSLEPFSEIWFMILLTRPARIWPATDVGV